MKVAWLIQNLVPYHHARFEAFARLEDVDGHLIQVTDKDVFGVLEFRPGSTSYELHTLFKARDRDGIPAPDLKVALAKTLTAIRPDCVCASGWGLEIGWLMQEWALAHRIPVVLFSESTAHDEPRKWIRERIKSILVKSCQSAVVGGASHKDYVCRLGMPPESVFTGHNVVDSRHFAAEATGRPANLPEALEHVPYFLSCTRFGEKKNLPRLVRAYARFDQSSNEVGRERELLVIAGDGEMRPEIERSIDETGMQDRALLLGAVGYDALPWLYQNGQAFVHASTIEQWGLVVNEAMAAGCPVLVSNRCGCAMDLVQEGRNGWAFDPFNEEDIANTLLRFSSLPQKEKQAMGASSKQLIAAWGPDRFAQALKSAVDLAMEAPMPSDAAVARQLLRFMLKRGNP